MADTPPPIPKNPFELNWYVQRPTQADGPLTGYVLKDMIAAAQIGANTNVAEMGATSWTRLADIPAFAALLPATPAVTARQPGTIEYAGFWIRLLAYIIDVLVLEFFTVVAGLILGLGLAAAGVLGKIQPPADSHDLPHGYIAIFWIVGLAVTVAYNVYFNGGSWQATPGKRLLGLHLITTTGEPVGGWLAFGRWAAYALDGLTLYIGFLMIGWTREKTALHDIVCGTRVVYGKL